MDLRDKLRDTRTNWKATLTNYDYVLALGTSRRCFSLDQQEIALILSLLDPATWRTRWYSPSGLNVSQALISELVGRTAKDLMNDFECEGGGSMAGCMHYVSEVFWKLDPSVPAGCLAITTGGTWNKVDYPELWELLPDTVKDETTFTFPDMTGRTLVGQDFQYQSTYPNHRQVMAGDTAGEITVVMSEVEMPVHYHLRTPAGQDIYDHNLTSGTGGATHALGTVKYDVGHTTGNAGGNMPHNNMPPVFAGYWFVQAETCSTESDNFAIRLMDCELQYSVNGSPWVLVENWGTLDECMQDTLPFDLRFNNCVLEYSKDSAQTWNAVPGWSDVQDCFVSSPSTEFKFENGVLWYSNDGGETWNAVFGWNRVYDSVENVIEQKERCQTAYGVARCLAEVAYQLFRQAVLDNGTLEEYTQSVYLAWHNEGLPEPIPSYLDDVIAWMFSNEAEDSQILEDLRSELTVQSRAEFVYSACQSGRWCDDNIERYERWLACEPLAARYHILMWMVFIATRLAYDEQVIGREDFRAWLWQMRDYGQCGECNLQVIELCSLSGPYENCWVFSDGLDGFEVSTDGSCWELTSNGIDTVDNYATCLEDYRTDIDAELAANGSEGYARVTGRAVSMGGGQGVTIYLFAKVAGNWVMVDSDNAAVVNEQVIAEGSLPANTEAIRIRIASPGSARLVIEKFWLQGDGVNLSPTKESGEC